MSRQDKLIVFLSGILFYVFLWLRLPYAAAGAAFTAMMVVLIGIEEQL